MKSFEEIYKQHYEDVYKYLRGLTADEHLAEDLVSETFLRAMKSLDKFRGDCDLRVWLCQIGKNSYLSYVKHQNRFTDDEISEEIVATESSIEKLLADKEVAFDVHRALHKLKEPYREIFSLRVFGELSFREIGKLFQKSDHWACVSYHRAKEMIKKNLSKRGEEI